MQAAAFGNNEFPVTEVILVCAKSACFKVFFSTVVDKTDKQSQAEQGLGSIPDAPAVSPPPNIRMSIEMREKGGYGSTEFTNIRM